VRGPDWAAIVAEMPEIPEPPGDTRAWSALWHVGQDGMVWWQVRAPHDQTDPEGDPWAAMGSFD